MELSLFQKILAELFIVTYMLSVGLMTKQGDVIQTLTQVNLTYKALCLNYLVMPTIGIALTYLFVLPTDIKIGLILLSISPGGLFTLNFVRVSGGNINFAVALICLLSLLSIVITPLLAYLFLGKSGLLFSSLWFIVHLGLLIALPLYAGRLLSDYLPQSPRIATILGFTSIIVFISFNLLTSDIKSNALHGMDWNALVIIVLLVVAGWFLGWALGGAKIEDKKVMAISTSMRNVAFCYPFALHEFADTDVILPIIAFSAISIVMNMGLALGLKEKNGRTH